MGSGDSKGGSEGLKVGGAEARLRVLCAAAVTDPAAALATNFLLRSSVGPIEAMAPSSGNADLAAGLVRLREAVEGGRIEDAGDGYLLVAGVADSAGATWLIRVRDARLAVAFEFETHAAAASAVPPRLGPRSGIEIVEAAIWALAKRDVSTVLALLDDDFTYSDPELGISLTGAATAVNQLLLLHHEIDERILIDLRYRDLGHGIIEVTGRVVEPDDPAHPGRWRILEYVENGRIKSTTRYPDLPGE